MAESQNIEWKESWRDEYLKWICGFANSQGGKLYIGVNDNGEPVGVEDAKKLLEDIPNKIQNTMGIVADVNLLTSDSKQYIEISVYPSSYPVNYKGEYHYRSGSTKQQLKGAMLTEFLVTKTGYRWDSVPMDNITVDELDKESFDIFRREAIRSGRMSKEDLDMDNVELLDSLGLLSDGKLKRAAVMMFYRKPERFISGCYLKIGRFGDGADLKYQDDVHGSLFIIADRAVDLIYLKYLTAEISYNNETRIETYPFPREAVREAVFNALIHSNWVDGIPVQIRIEDEAMYISNSCVLPEGWSVDTLKQRHRSRPYNPDIANTFYRAGYVESWGRGIQKMLEVFRACGTDEPEYEILGNDLTLKFNCIKPKRHNEVLDEVLDDVLEFRIINVLKQNDSITQKQLAKSLGVSVSTLQREMTKMVDKKIIEREGGKRFGHWIINV